jgi:hypothetical protein
LALSINKTSLTSVKRSISLKNTLEEKKRKNV